MARSLAIWLVVGASFSAGCGGEEGSDPAPRANRKNLVLVMLDTTRPDLLSAYGYPEPTTPFLESFAASGTRFDRAYSSSSWTLPATATIFTGTLPAIHGATQKSQRIHADRPLLAERLRDAGYQTAGFTHNPWISERTDIARGWDTFQGPWMLKFRWLNKKIPDDHPYLERPQVLGAIDAWMGEERDPARPFFLFVNLMEPHAPYIPTLPGARPFLDVETADDLRAEVHALYPTGKSTVMNRHYGGEDPLSREEWEKLTRLYKGTLRSLDRVVEQILERVDAVSDPENTIVLILSDHGENLGEHGHVDHMFNLYDTNLRVVLLARGPGFDVGAVETERAHLADVHATFLLAAGLEPERDAIGCDLREPLPKTRVLSASLGYPELSLSKFGDEVRATGLLERYERELRAAIGPRYKLIRSSTGDEEIFDLLADPDETRPLSEDEVDRAELARLREAVLAAGRIAKMRGQPGQAPELDPDSAELMRQLGYLR